MNAIIQKTKLYFPSPRDRLVDRLRLIERLNTLKLPSHPLGLISAPAGSGKTTLVVQWLAGQSDWSIGWVSLDARDNQPARFFTYFIAALQTTDPQIGKKALELLQMPGVNLEEVIALLSNDLLEAPSSMLVVLDDFHHINDPLLCHAIDLFIDAQPPKLSLLLITREDPSLELARLRANDRLVELRQDDLRFSLPETISFLNRCMGLSLDSSQVENLEARTEGWIAGLQMAALSLQHTPDVDGFINDFSGSHRYILDYLMEEVLSHQPADVQDFLLETSILDRLCAGLCARVTQKTTSDAQRLLETLGRTNLFITSLDEVRYWYRYHHLFNDLLVARLMGSPPERPLQLYRRASDWFEENGESRLAVEYALKAHDDAHAADLIESHFSEAWQKADVEFCNMIFQLPDEVIHPRSSLCLDTAWFHVLAGQFGLVPPLLEAAHRSLADPKRVPEPTDSTNRAFAKAIQAFLDDFKNQPVTLDDSLIGAFNAIPAANLAMRNSVAVLLGTLCYMEGDFTNTARYCQYALDNDTRANGTIAIPISVMRMVWALQAQGKLHQAMELIVEYETYVRQRGNRRYYISGALNLMWGEILFEWNRLDEAEAQYRQGLHLLEDWTVPQSFALGMSLLARLQLARGDIAGARTTLQTVQDKYTVEDFHPAFVHYFQKAQVRLWIVEQNTAVLETFCHKIAPLVDLGLTFRVESSLIELCRAWIALGRYTEAIDLLKRLNDSVGDRIGSRVSILVLLVSALRSQPILAQAYLEDALHLGESEGYLRSFIEGDYILRQSLELWLKNPHPKENVSLHEYGHRILLAFDQAPSTSESKIHPGAELPEQFTPREMDVLRLLAAGYADKQIAENLFLARGTVKFYVHVILQKLDVHSRTQAIARARELNLL